MSFSLESFPNPTTTELLVVVYDLTNYLSFARQASSFEVFQALDQFYKMSGEHIRASGGHVIKFIGDAGLAIYSPDDADRAINSLMEMKREIDVWLKRAIPGSSLAVNCHFGDVTVGPMHGPNGKYLEIVGDTVNICFTLGRKRFTISPQAFRKLKPESRKNFKKFTPPIVYNLG